MSQTSPDHIIFDAAVLGGGRSSRLGGTAKSSLQLDGQTLLRIACAAAVGARRLVVVGTGAPQGRHCIHNAEVIREDPPFGGPAAAVAAAVVHLRPQPAAWLLVLACDMPRIARAVPVLLDAAARSDRSVLARDDSREQPLAALYRTADLDAAVRQIGGSVRNLSMRALLATVQWSAVDVPHGTTMDVDTWADARALGVLAATDQPQAKD
ncbi:NTP transferase domain-containing protein [Arthrobacter sp. H5]|uniref:molybdenum cofactor guanylyltransferase n=1 Tax=Arthrobacter sp. H5 TaxID=1267973 RepID=UPI0004B59EC0|nr:NTP transferase domain-containing protein [Arthrobacter sp. H5]